MIRDNTKISEDEALKEFKKKFEEIDEKYEKRFWKKTSILTLIAIPVIICILIVAKLSIEEASKGKFGTYMPYFVILMVIASIIGIYGSWIFRIEYNLKQSKEHNKILKEYFEKAGLKDEEVRLTKKTYLGFFCFEMILLSIICLSIIYGVLILAVMLGFIMILVLILVLYGYWYQKKHDK